MASGFFVLLDDIATLMDDVVVMSKISAKKTAGILGDDLAVNAEKATGFVSSRELPVLWAITKGSLLNKLIILPIAFLLNAFLPEVIIWALILGGVYLAFEGVEKIYEFLVPEQHQSSEALKPELETLDPVALEKKKIKSAILTDFILSVEIIIIALGTVSGKPMLSQAIVVFIIAIVATIGVYGIVALIVRMDDVGYRLIRLNARKTSVLNRLGTLLITGLPWVIKGLSVIGTIALLLVSGGIFVHNIDYVHHFLDVLPTVPDFVKQFVLGVFVGGLAFLLIKMVSLLKRKLFSAKV